MFIQPQRQDRTQATPRALISNHSRAVTLWGAKTLSRLLTSSVVDQPVISTWRTVRADCLATRFLRRAPVPLPHRRICPDGGG
jgi:hypothetical protein